MAISESKGSSSNKSGSNPRSGASRSGKSRSEVASKPKDTSSVSIETKKAEPPADKVELNPDLESNKNSSNFVDNMIDSMKDWFGGDEEVPDGKKEVNSGKKTPDASANAPKLDLDQGELLSRGSNGEKVTQLQEMLKESGIDLAVDGKFGPETARAVEEFQRKHNLEKIDGIVGPETMGALNGGETPETEQTKPGEVNDPAKPGERGQIDLPDPNMTEAEKHEYFSDLLEANGGKMNLDGPTVLALRGVDPSGKRNDSNKNVGTYTDTFVVLNTGKDGKPSVDIFNGSTHANAYSSRDSFGPDKNNNRINGVAMLQPGSYEVNYGVNSYNGTGKPSYHVTDNGNGMVPAFRDLNADGVISSSERNAAINGGYEASGILFHDGRRENRPSTIGCQVLPPSQYMDFVNAVGRNGFDYTLIDANDAWVPA